MCIEYGGKSFRLRYRLIKATSCQRWVDESARPELNEAPRCCFGNLYRASKPIYSVRESKDSVFAWCANTLSTSRSVTQVSRVDESNHEELFFARVVLTFDASCPSLPSSSSRCFPAVQDAGPHARIGQLQLRNNLPQPGQCASIFCFCSVPRHW